MKGPLGTVTQILITVGIMVSFFLGLPIPDFTNHPEERLSDDFMVLGYWRVMFALPIVFAIIQSLLLLTVFNYDTPKFMKQNNQFA